MKKNLSLFLVFLLISNLFIPALVSADNVAEGKVEHLLNSGFIDVENAGETYGAMWAGEIKPTYWDMRNWGSSGGGLPQAAVITESGSSIVEIELDSTVGFYQHQDAVTVVAGETYDFNAKVKTQDISTPHYLQNAVSLRIEELDENDSLVLRKDLAFIKNHTGDSGWVDLSDSHTMHSNTAKVKVILVMGVVSEGNGSTGTIAIDEISMTSDAIPVSSIDVSTDPVVLEKGQQTTLDYEVIPINATKQDIEWTSADDSIATVSSEGEVEAIAPGLTTITIKSTDNPNVEATFEVEVLSDEIPSEDTRIEHLLNGDFIEHESINSTFADMWVNEIKPTHWELRNWASSGGSKPLAEVVDEDGSSIVALELAGTVGFYQYEKDITVQPGETYDFTARVKTKDISTPHTNKNAVTLRVEEWDDSSVLARRDIAFVKNHPGESEWIDLTNSITMGSNTKEIRIIIVTGNVSAGHGATGTLYLDSISMKSDIVPIESIEITTNAIVAAKGEVTQVDYVITPSNATIKDLVWSSEDESIATVSTDGKVTAVDAGTTTITVTSLGNLSVQARLEIEVLSGEVQPTEIKFVEESIDLFIGRGAILEPIILPANASNQEVIWSSSDENIVTVKAGVVKALEEGTAIVTAEISDTDLSASIEITVQPYEDDEFDIMRKNWADNVVPNKHIDLENPQISQSIQDLSDNASELWADMQTERNRDYLWADAASPSESADVTTNYRRLDSLARAYATIGTDQYQNEKLLKDIISGLDWMHEHRYNSHTVTYKNWWDWQIGAPHFLNDIVTVLYDYLTNTQIDNYMDTIKTNVPKPTEYYGVGGATWKNPATGANLVDLTKVVTVQGIISKEASRIESGRDNFPVIEVKTSGKGNGVYEDGSFVDHTNIAYTGTYGVVLLGSMVDMIYLLEGSTYSLNKADLNNIYDMILNAFQPVIYRGLMLDMVNGRAISRETQDIGHGRGAIERIIQYTEFAPEEYKGQLESMVKHWIMTSDIQDMPAEFKRIPVISMAGKIMNDSAIEPRGDIIKHYNFANMDRVVHKRPGYLFGLSMYSDRIAAYEGNMNGENLKAHYTGSGMTYLYNNDLNQYNEDFWATVDFYRLPGITVDVTKQIAAGVGTARTSPQSWVGGSTIDGLYGINGMALDQSIYNQSLKGKKSWFMFDDEIVALGTDIHSSDDREIETIVDNRKIKDDGSNAFYVDGQQMSSGLDWTEGKENVSWAHLSGNVADSDIGYYFPEKQDIMIKKEARTGAWKDININGSEDAVTRNYLSMQIEHGKNPENADYAYVILPNKSKADTEAYATNSTIEIIANDAKAQAVRENELNILGVNFWSNEKTTVDKVTSYDKASVMVKEIPGDMLEVAVSDPTHKNNVIELELDYPISGALKLDNRVTIIESTLEKTKIAIDVSGAMGASIVAKFNLDEEADAWESVVIYENDFEAGTDGETIEDWEQNGGGEAYYTKFIEPLVSKKDFSGSRSFDAITGNVTVEYEFTPLSNAIDVVMGLAGEEQVIKDYPDFPVIVRASVNNNGKFDARNGNVFTSDLNLAWEKDKTYHIRVEVDLDNKTYDVFITPEAGEEVQLAAAYDFRDTAETPTDIGQLIMQDNKVDKGSMASNLQVNGVNRAESNQVMQIDSNNDTFFMVEKQFESHSPRIFYDWTFMEESLANSAFVLLNGVEEGIRLEVENNQLIDRLNNQIIISSLEEGKWYDLSLDVNSASGEYSIFVDDVLKYSSTLPETYRELNESSYAFQIEMQQSESTMYVDDILIRGNDVEIEELNIDSEHTSIGVGNTMQMEAIVKPSNAFLGGLRWSSANEDIATITSDGIVTAISEGTVIITAIDRVTGLRTTKELIIEAAPTLEAVVLSGDKTTIKVDERVKLRVEGLLSDDSAADLSEANITYESSHPDIVSISESGEVTISETPEGLEEIKVWATVELNGETVTSNELVLVVEKVVDKTALTDTIDTAQSLLDDAETGEYPASAIKSLQEVIDLARTLADKADARQEEIDVMTVELQVAIAGFEASKLPPAPTLEAVVLSGDKTTIKVDEQVKLTVEGLLSDDSAADLSEANITYESSHPDIVSISELGEVTISETPEGVEEIKVWAIVELNGETVTSNELVLVVEKVVDKTALTDTIDTAQSLLDDAETGEYPASAIKSLQEVIDLANALAEQADARQEEVDVMTMELEKAIADFEALLVQPVEPEEPKEEDETTDEGQENDENQGEDETTDEGQENDENQEEDQTTDEGNENDGDKNGNEVNIETENSNEFIEEGNQLLPKTYTNIYNFIWIGIILLVLGGITNYLYRRREEI